MGALEHPLSLAGSGANYGKDYQVEPLVIGFKTYVNIPGKECATRYRGWWDLRFRGLRVQLRLLALNGLGGRLRVEIELLLGGAVIIILRDQDHMVLP
jgi:hypothetical protein